MKRNASRVEAPARAPTELRPIERTITTYRDLSMVEEHELIRSSQAGDVVAKKHLLTLHLPLVESLVRVYRRRRYRNRYCKEELESLAVEGLNKGIEKFDLSHPVRLSTYAVWWMKVSINRFIQREPLVGWTKKSVFIQLDEPTSTDGGVFGNTVDRRSPHETYDLRPDGAPCLDEDVASRLKDEAVAAVLDRYSAAIGPMGMDIVKTRLMAGGRRLNSSDTLSEIGDRWGLSRERVRQEEARIIALLRKPLGEVMTAWGEEVPVEVPQNSEHPEKPIWAKRTRLVGEDNPHSDDPKFALYFKPAGSAGSRLCLAIFGMRPRDYMRSFQRQNLCASKWNKAEARVEAAAAARAAADMDQVVVLLGERVFSAFQAVDTAVPAGDWEPFTTAGRYVFLPHPSGRSRLWNPDANPDAIPRARATLLSRAPWLSSVIGKV